MESDKRLTDRKAVRGDWIFRLLFFTSECVAFMSMGGVWGEKSAWSIPVNFFSLLSRSPVENQIADYRGLKLVYIVRVPKSCRNRAEVVFELEVSRLPWEMAFFLGYSFYSWFFLDVLTFDSFVFTTYSVGVSEPPGPPNIARCIPLKGHGEGC